MYKKKSILYVNYAPYENSGKILDFLLDNFEYVFLFSIGFYNLKNKRSYNYLFTYKNRKLQEKHFFIKISAPSFLTFYLIPLVSAINFTQILFYTFLLKQKFGKIDIYFTVNAFTSWIGLVLKKIGLVDKTVFWVWDYYPAHKSKIVTIMRRIYWQFDKISSHSDQVIFVNQRLINLRKGIGILPQKASYPVVSIGTELISKFTSNRKNSVVLGFIGVIKKSQGLEMVFENADTIMKDFPRARIEIVGSGPDEEYFKKMAKDSSFKANFHGFAEGDSFNKILAKCTIGIAPYIPDKSNVSHYGDPGKIKRYLSLGLPVIATNAFEFSSEISKYMAGEIISYNHPSEFVGAIKKIVKNYGRYRNNAIRLSKKYFYKKIYPQLFEL